MPCLLLFDGDESLVEKVKKLLSYCESLDDESTERNVPKKIKLEEAQVIDENGSKIENTDSSDLDLAEIEVVDEASCDANCEWLSFQDMKLSKSDKAIIENGQCLNDLHIHFAQNMLQYYFPDAEGLKNSLFQYRMKLAVSYNIVQILHTRSSHWVVISNVQSGAADVIDIYDTMYDQVDHVTMNVIHSIFDGKVQINLVKDLQKQKGGTDCGVFAIAIATSLLHKVPVLKFNQSSLRDHLISCFENYMLTPFP